MHTLFSHEADSVDFDALARALSRLPAAQTDYVPPVPVELSEAVARRLISVEVYNDYTDSKRLIGTGLSLKRKLYSRF